MCIGRLRVDPSALGQCDDPQSYTWYCIYSIYPIPTCGLRWNSAPCTKYGTPAPTLLCSSVLWEETYYVLGESTEGAAGRASQEDKRDECLVVMGMTAAL